MMLSENSSEEENEEEEKEHRLRKPITLDTKFSQNLESQKNCLSNDIEMKDYSNDIDKTDK